MSQKKTNIEVKWDKSASERHDNNALDIERRFDEQAAVTYLNDIDNLENTIAQFPMSGRVQDPVRYPQRRRITSKRGRSLVYDYDPALEYLVVIDISH